MILKRLLLVLPLLAVVSVGVVGLESMLPGNAAVTLAGQGASIERIREIEQTLNLNEPFLQRYLDWLGGALRGDFGVSLYTRRSVMAEIGSRWAVTLSLVVGAVILSLIISVPAAIFAARKEGGRFDRMVSVAASIGVAVPDFVIGIVLAIIFAITLKQLPIAGYVPMSESIYGWLTHMILPMVALSAAGTAILTRQLRSDLATVLRDDYIRTAYAKGLRTGTILVKHGLRAAAPPTVSVLGVQVARMLGGAVVIETVFALPGLGSLTVASILNRDLPVIQGIVPLMVITVVLCNLAADLGNMALSPRTRAVR
jgi:peptide/nickel transport system permease protein